MLLTLIDSASAWKADRSGLVILIESTERSLLDKKKLRVKFHLAEILPKLNRKFVLILKVERKFISSGEGFTLNFVT